MKFRNIENYPTNYIGQAYIELVLQLTRKEIMNHKDPETLRTLSLVKDVYNKVKDRKVSFIDVSIGDIDDSASVQRMFRTAGIKNDEENYYYNKLSYTDYIFCNNILNDYIKNGYSHSLYMTFKDATKYDKRLLNDIISLRLNPSDINVTKRVFNSVFADYNKKSLYLYETLTPVFNKDNHFTMSIDEDKDPYITMEYIMDTIKDRMHLSDSKDPVIDIYFDDNIRTLISKCEKSPIYTAYGIDLPIIMVDDKFISLSDVLNKINHANIIVEYEKESGKHSTKELDSLWQSGNYLTIEEVADSILSNSERRMDKNSLEMEKDIERDFGF